MATDVLANIIDVLNKEYDEKLRKQWVREARIAKDMGFMQGFGKSADWVAQFSQGAAVVVGEASDVQASELTNDVEVPASLSWGIYRSGFSLSDLELSAAASSRKSLVELQQILALRMSGSMSKIVKLINTDIWTGTGTSGGNPNIVGLTGGALADTGTYATINRATYPEWEGNVLANGGNPRPLTTDLLAQAEEEVFIRAGSQFADPSNFKIWTTPAIYRKYEQLFINGTSTTPLVFIPQGMTYDQGSRKLSWHGIPMERDVDCPSGTLVFVNAAQVKLQQLIMPNYSAYRPMPSGSEASDVPGLSPFVYTIGRKGNYHQIVMEAQVQMSVFRPNCMAVIEDIDET